MRVSAETDNSVMIGGQGVRKPRALRGGSVLLPIAPASPADFANVLAGAEELRRLGFHVEDATPLTSEGYFAGSALGRLDEFLHGLQRDDVDGLVAIRGGYGSNYILDGLAISETDTPKVILGYSDITSLQAYLWKKYAFVGFYAPMLAAGLAAGEGATNGYDRASLLAAIGTAEGGWTINLKGEALAAGEAEGRVLGGCLTLVETTIGTPWELETQGAILLLEDRGMKPWQVDRALMHLKQAGKFQGVRGIVLGDFPECDAPMSGSPGVRDVCTRILGELGVPMVYGAPVGHTQRPILTVPLGVRARLTARADGALEILEPAVVG
ncbi:MAG TPA: LD-carboxypeptidase [Candidatus Methylomirabilis sp.]|nr:LD-carboxypeptidase [Candidatus Methylomirabilis sp.]